MSIVAESMLGHAPEFRSLLRAAALVAPTDATVLISGESGTGKELLAHAIHQQSRRRHAPLITINCAALPEALAESELFGHHKGAFTGAVQQQIGRVQAAHGGTLFLDEIAEISPSVQAKLLRLLESGECQTVGVPHTSKVDLRIIAATNKNLQEWVRLGRFREDLYFRLNVVPLELPPLRQRREDLSLLLEAFANHFATRNSLQTPHYGACALQLLKNYSWPGNIRELRNFCERMSILYAGQKIIAADLPWEMRQATESALPMRASQLFALPVEGVDFEQLERQLIDQALERSGGNKSHAARLLGFSRDTFLYRLKKFSIPV
ncbi:sigma-54 interaction domain-containing protein [Candidatus Magnetaquicoccus inordinatus]|uniref:sigma-54 interaction domain-containing protein n=1 Tax=Candidatus Magnetaquicoccus inordinatus TaxID=2496818 RepID=UPI00102CC8DD|nr:sigma-54 dependent transcriptional regulator [Candidatus Magnetaquicoccus inordinatus]